MQKLGRLLPANRFRTSSAELGAVGPEVKRTSPWGMVLIHLLSPSSRTSGPNRSWTGAAFTGVGRLCRDPLILRAE